MQWCMTIGSAMSHGFPFFAMSGPSVGLHSKSGLSKKTLTTKGAKRHDYKTFAAKQKPAKSGLFAALQRARHGGQECGTQRAFAG